MFSNQISPRNVAILGSSGSIGQNTLDVIHASEGHLKAVLLSVHRNTEMLIEQARQCPDLKMVVVTDETANRDVLSQLPRDVEVRFGQDALCESVQNNEIDVILSAIVGSAGLSSTWSALECGKTVALANKESLVMGGSLLTELARKTGGHILPVDSEHSAIWQALQSWRMDAFPNNLLTEKLPNKSNPSHSSSIIKNKSEGKFVTTTDSEIKTECCEPCSFNESVARIILTASGGPFRTYSHEELERVSISDALCHPTWNMGKKITVDSATLINKALEIIEARWFFDMHSSKIDVVIHPQSIVHSFVEFCDGSTIAQLSPPDMRLPIQLALTFPKRMSGIAKRLDFSKPMSLDFFPPDLDQFPAIALGLEVASVGGTAGCVLSAANEIAVAAFLEGQISFTKIVPICRSVLDNHSFEERPSLSRLFELDQWGRNEAQKIARS
ncbi:MAG: 1-deoxy-D-xylulose-5-phosphate reductoisomerase [Thermoguttaceae bacterium]